MGVDELLCPLDVAVTVLMMIVFVVLDPQAAHPSKIPDAANVATRLIGRMIPAARV